MAKLRVYELAKELKLDNKDLVRQLIELGLDVRNHMSVISPEEAQVVRDRLKEERSEVVEEKRVTTQVIRRRRRQVESEEAEAEMPEVALKEAPAAAAPREDLAEPAQIGAPSEPEPQPEPPAAQVPEPETVPPEPEPTPTVVAAEETAPAAVQPPPLSPAPAAPEPGPAPSLETVPEPEPRPEPQPEPPVEAKTVPPAATTAQPPELQATAPEMAPTLTEAQAAPVAPATLESTLELKVEDHPPQRRESRPSPPQVSRPDAKPPAAPAGPAGQVGPGQRQEARPEAAKAPKRSVVDMPARIISRPTQPVAPPTEKRQYEPPPRGYEPRPSRPPSGPGGYRPAAPAPADTPPPERSDDKTGRRRKKGKKTASMPDDEMLMRKAGAGKRKEILDKADLYDMDRHGRGKRRGAPVKKKKTEITTPKAIKRRVKVGEAITVAELAKRMGVKSAEVVGRLMRMGMMLTANQSLDLEDAALVAAEFGFEIERVAFEEEGLLEQAVDRPEDLRTRPPVVTIMGHVDHGKTSLLDAIRRTNVAGGEAGGITQHIGAYNVHLPHGGQVVFLDTPGHAAFTQMRARGAQVTDVVVLVVAADDGVMQQTKEAISHSREAGVPIVVAVNKIDKPGADPARVRRELADQGLVPEDWGGDTIYVEVSAKTGQGIDTLLEMLQLQSEVLELTANPNKAARGHILEARLDKGRGPVATVLVQEGTLKAGDAFVCGVHSGRVRALFDDLGRRVDDAGPAIPVEVQGFTGVPEAGDEFVVVENDKVAKQIAEHRAMKKREAELSSQTRLSLEGFFEQMKEGAVQELKLVVKADVQGSVEAMVDALNKLGNEQVKVNVIHSATGAITETDVMLASASNAIIIGFNVRPTGKVTEIAEAEHVDIRTYDVIYQVIDDVTAALTGLLAPVIQEEVLGRAVVRETFTVPKVGTIAGCAVTSGKVERNAQARLLRDGVVVATTKLASLRRFKDDVKEVLQGYECGIGLENYNDIKVGDEIEVYVTREVAAQL
ncbi:MAG: translation initiation factor IF-2 [Desulfarculus sp.]|nr:translation initiation factor IF-2 [Desulfarculus sp.]